MKRSTCLILFFPFLISPVLAQPISDSIAMGAGYGQDSYYSLSQGEIAMEDNTNWDLAFDVTNQGSSIRVNSATRTELYLYSNGDTADWNSPDTSGMAAWPQLYDSDTSWSLGAFEATLNGTDPFDIGWGIYNPISHVVKGDSIYLVKVASGWKKLWIQTLLNGSYNFRYANIDGSDDRTASLKKADFADKNFGYYSLADHQQVDREPEKQSYDLIFTRYMTQVAPGLYYSVTGVLQNMGVTAAKVHPVNDPEYYTDHSAHTLSTSINTIGYDWKRFDNTTFEYIIEDSLLYFVKDTEGSIWKMIFSGFGGSANGKMYFQKELVLRTGLKENFKAEELQIFPNPSTAGQVNIIHPFEGENAELQIYDLAGKMQSSTRIAGADWAALQISTHGLRPGIYLVSLRSRGHVFTQKLFIK
ncbi:MAG: T9SS type A sorting domain-containing protein [Bacteroidia bacterium]